MNGFIEGCTFLCSWKRLLMNVNIPLWLLKWFCLQISRVLFVVEDGVQPKLFHIMKVCFKQLWVSLYTESAACFQTEILFLFHQNSFGCSSMTFKEMIQKIRIFYYAACLLNYFKAVNAHLIYALWKCHSCKFFPLFLFFPSLQCVPAVRIGKKEV